MGIFGRLVTGLTHANLPALWDHPAVGPPEVTEHATPSSFGGIDFGR